MIALFNIESFCSSAYTELQSKTKLSVKFNIRENCYLPNENFLLDMHLNNGFQQSRNFDLNHKTTRSNNDTKLKGFDL